MLNTTHGLLEESSLAKTVGFEDRPTEFVVWVEWRLTNHNGTHCTVCANPDNPRPENDRTLVRRDAHLILKEPSVVADALAASL
jgi:hypothetical protein